MKTLILSILSLALVGCSGVSVSLKPTRVQRAQQEAEAIRLAAVFDGVESADYFLLDPSSSWRRAEDPPDQRPKILQWSVTGSGRAHRAHLETLRKALSRAVAQATPDLTIMCFNPRHAISLPGRDGPVVVVICFECAKGFSLAHDKKTWFKLGGDEEPTFDQVAREIGILGDSDSDLSRTKVSNPEKKPGA